VIDPLGLIAARAAADGLDPIVAKAVAIQESGGNPQALGDLTADPRGYVDPATGKRWASLGAFQENIAGGAGQTFLDAGGSIAGLFDPIGATDRFVSRYQSAAAVAFVGQTPGEIAAAAQRPANPTAFAASVDALIASLGGSTASPVPATSSTPKPTPIAGIVGVPGNTGPASPGVTPGTAACRKLSGIELLAIAAASKLGKSPHELAVGAGMSDECLRANLYGAATDLPDPSKIPVVGGFAGGIAAAISGPDPGGQASEALIVIIVVIALLLVGMVKVLDS